MHFQIHHWNGLKLHLAFSSVQFSSLMDLHSLIQERLPFRFGTKWSHCFRTSLSWIWAMATITRNKRQCWFQAHPPSQCNYSFSCRLRVCPNITFEWGSADLDQELSQSFWLIDYCCAIKRFSWMLRKGNNLQHLCVAASTGSIFPMHSLKMKLAELYVNRYTTKTDSFNIPAVKDGNNESKSDCGSCACSTVCANLWIALDTDGYSQPAHFCMN
jgi:hypothetical protein